MNPTNADQNGMAWLLFAFITVIAWGLYGIFLHSGQVFMKDAVHGRSKAFLFVGLAYFLTAVVAPLVVLWWQGASWSFTARGMSWSLAAGVLGAIGAFFVLVSFGAGGRPSYVMSIIFAGAPVVNALVAIWLHPPAGGWGAIRWQFVLGIFLAATGGCLVAYFKPPPGKAAAATVAAQDVIESPAADAVTDH
jgi:MFS family permease